MGINSLDSDFLVLKNDLSNKSSALIGNTKLLELML